MRRDPIVRCRGEFVPGVRSGVGGSCHSESSFRNGRATKLARVKDLQIVQLNQGFYEDEPIHGLPHEDFVAATFRGLP